MKTWKKFNHVNASTLTEAINILSSGNNDIIAGGTDLLGTLRFEVLDESPDTVVNIKTIPGLNHIKEEGGTLKIGALALLEDIAKSSVVKSKWGALAEAARRTASPHIREMATIGGNICQLNRCWYFRCPDNRFNCLRKSTKGTCYALTGENRYHSIFGAASGCVAVNPSDTAPALVAFNATVVTSKREIPIEDFFTTKIAPNGSGSTVLDKDEIVTEIKVPSFSGKSSFVKFAIRKSIDFAIVNCAAAIGDNYTRICLNAVYNTPKRVTSAEDYIKGKAINEDNAEAAGEEAIKGTIALSRNKWKIQVAKAMVKKAILACK